MITERDGRPTFLQTMLTIAHTVAQRSTCPRQKTGAVVCSPAWEILTTGYNGAPAGLSHCSEVGCLIDDAGHCVRTVHAESNAVVQAARVGVSTRLAVVLSTHRPCVRCATALIQAGVAAVYYVRDYQTDNQIETVREMFRQAGVALYKTRYVPVYGLPPV